jgi:hypothetical protein
MRTGSLKERRSTRLLMVTIFYSCPHYTVDSLFVDQCAVLYFLNELRIAKRNHSPMKSWKLKSQNSAKIYGKILNLSPVLPHCFLLASGPTRHNSDHVMDSDGKLARVFRRLVPFRRPVASLWHALAA